MIPKSGFNIGALVIVVAFLYYAFVNPLWAAFAYPALGLLIVFAVSQVRASAGYARPSPAKFLLQVATWPYFILFSAQ